MTAISIQLDIKEIVYDIQNKTYLTGKSRKDGSNHEQVANMQANDDEENANQILRSISVAFSALRNKLAEYLALTEKVADNAMVDPDKPLILSLNMPGNYNTSTVSTLAAMAHQYIVSHAVAQWFAITNKPDSAQYTTLADTCLNIISEAMSKRVRPRRESVTDQ